VKGLASALAAFLLALGAVIGTASAQQPDRVYKIGWLDLGRPGLVFHPFDKWTGTSAAFPTTLREKGFISGKNLMIEWRQAEGDITKLRAQADALVATGPDVIVAGGTPAVVAAMQATRTIPIVFPGVGDPVGKGIVASLAKPGGNVTGMAVNTANPKMWQMLKDVAPHLKRVSGLSNALNSHGIQDVAALRARATEALRAEAATVGLDYTPMRLSTRDEIEPAIARVAAEGDAGIVIFTDQTIIEWREPIMAAALRHRLPTICSQWFEWAKAGCVLTYGEDWYAMRRGAALQIVQILRGARPADIPVEQPTTFKLIVNTQTAKALGLTIPASVAAIADEVIE
jgi:putative ABC transport system substrate-binding protein